jgi:hypothetical protein
MEVCIMMNIVRCNNDRTKAMINAAIANEQAAKSANKIIKCNPNTRVQPVEQLDGFTVTKATASEVQYRRIITGQMIANAMMDLRDPADDEIDM